MKRSAFIIYIRITKERAAQWPPHGVGRCVRLQGRKGAASYHAHSWRVGNRCVISAGDHRGTRLLPRSPAPCMQHLLAPRMPKQAQSCLGGGDCGQCWLDHTEFTKATLLLQKLDTQVAFSSLDSGTLPLFPFLPAPFSALLFFLSLP